FQLAATTAREPQGGARGRRLCEARLETEAGQPGAQLRKELPAPAEIAQAALDFEKEFLRRLERHTRRELAGPAGHGRQRLALGLRRRMPARQRLAPELREMERDPVHGPAS